MSKARTEIGHIRDADRTGKEAEHRRIVGRVADKQVARLVTPEIDAVAFLHQGARHAQLVVVAEPAVDVDRADFRGHAGRAHQRDDPVDLGKRQTRHVLAVVDGEIGLAVKLVRGERAARHFAQNLLAHGEHFFAVRRARWRVEQEALHQFFPGSVVIKIESAVLADHRVHRPHARDMVAPAGGPPGNRDDQLACRMQPLQRGIGARGELALARERVVDIAEHAADALHHRGRHLRERCHRPPAMRSATRRRCASLICRPHLVRRHSMSSAERAHSCSAR